MKRRQIPDGYISSFESHTRPAQPEPPPPIIQQKQAETLMGHCLKQFIKERLYGKLINYTRLHNNKKSNFNPPSVHPSDNYHPNVKSATSIKDNKQERYSEIRNNIEKRMDYRYNSIVRKTSLKAEEESHRNRSSFCEIEESLVLKGSRHRKNKSAFSSKNSIAKSSDRSIDHDIEKYKYSSFLSAIDEDEDKVTKPRKNNLKLSPLIKNNHLDQKLQKIKSTAKSPSLTRLELDKFVIKNSLWQHFSRKQKQKYDNQNQQPLSPTAKDPSILQNKSFNMNSESPGKQSWPGSIASIEKTKFQMPKNGFSKELFLEYLNNPKTVIKSAAQHLMQFFQLNGKVQDQMKPENYKQIFENMVTAGPRVWAICCFRFFDKDLNGLICVNDIFKLLKEVDQIQNSLKESTQDLKSIRSIQMISKLKDSLQQMRQLIIAKQLEDAFHPTEPATVENIDIKYLEESLLRKKEVRYSDLVLILGDQIKNMVKQTKRPVIQTTKDISIKMSSCYRYSFLATDHNEQTRQDRDRIETLKEGLKKQKIGILERQRQNELINKKLPGIEYPKFLQMKFHRVLKEIAFETFGIQI